MLSTSGPQLSSQKDLLNRNSRVAPLIVEAAKEPIVEAAKEPIAEHHQRLIDLSALGPIKQERWSPAFDRRPTIS